MGPSYIQRVLNETSTRLWINNPTADALERAIAAGAVLRLVGRARMTHEEEVDGAF